MRRVFNPYEERLEAEQLYDKIQTPSKLEELDKRISRCPVCNDWRFDEDCTAERSYGFPYCEWCGRSMRPRGAKKEWYPHAMAQATKRFCLTCYQKIMRGGEGALDKELDDAVESYWSNRVPILSGPINGND